MELVDHVFSDAQIALLANVERKQIRQFIKTYSIQAIPIETVYKKYSLDAVRFILSSLRSPKRPVISRNKHVFYNFKGGTGKSTLSSQIAYHLSLFGYNVLAIDLDPQAHMTLNLGYQSPTPIFHTMYDVLVNGVDINETIYSLIPGLDLIPANLQLTRVEVPLSQKTRREELLKRVLNNISYNYDFVIMDTNPTFSILNINALIAADQINIITATHPLSYHGLGLLIGDLKELLSDMRLSTPYHIIPNLYESKTVTAQEILGALQMNYRDSLIKTVIRKSEDLNLASKYGLPICLFAKKRSVALEDILDLTSELVNLSKNQHPNIKCSPQRTPNLPNSRVKNINSNSL